MSQQMPPQGTDLPVHARERLSRMRKDASHTGLFTSDLSVNEFLLVREAGFDPVGLVVGSSIYHIGYQRANWKQNQEMDVLTQAMYLTLIHKFSILPTSAGVQGTLSPDGVSGCPRKTFFLFSCRRRRQEKKGKVGRPHTPQRGWPPL